MKYPTVGQILEKVKSYELRSDFIEPDNKSPLKVKIKNLSLYNTATNGDLSWISSERFKSFAPSSFKGSLLISPNAPKKINSSSSVLILTENPKLLFAKIAHDFFGHLTEIRLPQIKDNAISKDAILRKNVGISKGAVIGPGVTLGRNVSIGPNTVIANCEVGENTVIRANCSIGFPGFGYVKYTDGSYISFPHVGKVHIGNNVHIGSNTCIDRGALGDTIICDGVKIDNLVHIAHNVRIGKNSIIIANTMIGGSTIVGEDTWVAPSASLLNKIQVEEGSIIGMGAVVIKNVGKKSVVVGNPGRIIRKTKG